MVRGILEAVRRSPRHREANAGGCTHGLPWALGLKDRALSANRSLAQLRPNTTATTVFGLCLIVRNVLLQQKSPDFPEKMGNAELLWGLT